MEVQAGICAGLLMGAVDVGGAVRVGLAGARRDRVRASDELDW